MQPLHTLKGSARMTVNILLITEHEQLSHQLLRLMAPQTYHLYTAQTLPIYLLPQVSGVIWDLTVTPLNPTTAHLLRSQVMGPIILINRRPQAAATINRYFSVDHFDDYLVHPDALSILARLDQRIWCYQQLQLPCLRSQTPDLLTVATLTLNLNTCQVTHHHETHHLSATHLQLLLFFMTHPNRLISRVQLAAAVWGTTEPATLRIIDTQISKLRHAIEQNPKQPQLLITVRRLGYLFKVPAP
jgi:two-component system alkaline phosphatase synthesis response regulator PhoP